MSYALSIVRQFVHCQQWMFMLYFRNKLETSLVRL